MTKMLYAAMGATARVAVAPAAQAAPVIMFDTAPDGSFSAGFSNGGVGQPTFSDVFNFTATVDGILNAIISTVAQTETNDVDFTSVTVSGGSLASPVSFTQISGDPNETQALNGLQLLAGNYTLTVNGTSPGQNGSYGGSLAFRAAAVPEPATWGMMLIGFGSIGCAMRRRPSARFAQAI